MFAPSLSFARSMALAAALAGLVAPTTAAWADDLVTVEGALDYGSDVKLPAKSVAVLQITDPDAGDGSPMLAEQRLPVKDQQPVPFSVQTDRDGFKPGREYVLRATILDDTTPTWTAEDVTLDPSKETIDVGTLKMQPYKAPPADSDSAAAASADDGEMRLQDLQGIEWVVEDVDGNALLDNSTVTLNFGVNGKLGGKASCNSYRATYVLDGDQLKVTGAAATKMACAPELMEQERNVLDILSNSKSLYLDDDGSLVIESQGGRTLTARSE